MRSLAVAVSIAALTATAAPAFAQSMDELVITGHGRNPPPVLSERVSYADLDLRYAGDRSELRQRVVYTARRVCRLVGATEPQSLFPSEMARSCEGVATNNAMRQVRVAVRQAYQRPSYAMIETIGVSY